MKNPIKKEIKEEDLSFQDYEIVEDCDMIIDFEAVKNSVKREVKEEEDYLEEYETRTEHLNY